MLSNFYPYLKVFHIIMFTSWMAGLFYLPRIFVNLAILEPSNPQQTIAKDILIGMAHRLYRFTFILSHVALLSGVLLLIAIMGAPVAKIAWLHAKVTLILGLFIYQYICKRHVRAFKNNLPTKSHVWYRWFNEVPVVVLVLIVCLAVLKPF